jgi:hypothetical protein
VIGGGGTEPFERTLRAAGFHIGLQSFALAQDGSASQVVAS